MSDKKGFLALRELNVNEHVEEKNGFSYLSWAWALDTLLCQDQEAEWEYPEPTVYPDGSVMMYCSVKAFGKTRKAHLPVLDYANKVIKNPNAFQINTTMQRCLVKAIALHGIGLYIYAGEDLPKGEERKEITRDQKILNRNIMYELAKCTNDVEIQSFVDKYAHDIKDMPEEMQGPINDLMSSKATQFKSGVLAKPPEFDFIDVEEAIAFAKEANAIVTTMQDLGKLHEIMIEIEPKIKGMDRKLSASKYKTPEGTPGQRLINAYNKRMEEK
jgi:hypothetical protein